MTLNAAYCEYLRFDGPVQVGSSHIARHLRGKGFSSCWLPHPQTPIRRLRGEQRDTVIEHKHDVVELKLSALLPHWTFDAYGPVDTALPKRLPTNIRFSGSIPYTELPRVLQSCTFGVIPFIRSPFTDGIHPIKLYYYHFLGCRVLSAALPEISPKADCIWTYDTAEKGLEILRDHEKATPNVPAIRRLASSNCWSDRLDPILDTLRFGEAQVVTPVESR